PVRPIVGGVELSLRPRGPDQRLAAELGGVDRGVDRTAGAHEAGPVEEAVAGEGAQPVVELIADVGGELRDHRKAAVAVAADIRRLCVESASGGDGAGARNGGSSRTIDVDIGEGPTNGDLGGPGQLPRAARDIAGQAEIEAVKVIGGVELVCHRE